MHHHANVRRRYHGSNSPHYPHKGLPGDDKRVVIAIVEEESCGDARWIAWENADRSRLF